MSSIICIVLNNFKNDGRVLNESISLKSAGYDVKVVALSSYDDDLKEFDEIDGILVHRIKLKYWPKNRFIKILKYIEYVYRCVKLYNKNDVFHCNDLQALPIGVIIKLFFNKKAKVVYDIHEFETEIYGISKFEKKMRYLLEKILIRHIDACFTVSKSIANEYYKLYGIRPVLIFNALRYVELEKTDKFREVLPIKKDSIIILYQGGFTKGRGLQFWLEAFKQRKDNKVVLVFMGYGELEDEIKNASNDSNNIFYHPAVTQDIMLKYTISATVGIVPYIYDSCLNHYYCMPNKIFEYTMVGLPVIVSNLRDLAQTVKKYNLGVVTKNDTPEAINEAIDELLSMDLDKLKDNALKFAKEYCWEEQEKKMIDEYRRILA